MFTRFYGKFAAVWLSFVIALCLGFWLVVPDSLRNQIEPTASAATFTVNSVDDHDDGTCNAADCTLREAINAANATGSGTRFVGFSIQGSGVHTINLSSPLPQITRSIDIDGGTANGMPLIEINGTNAGAASGLFLAGGSDLSIISNLVINRFNGFGLNVNSTGASIFGCLIGTNSAGTAAAANSAGGIRVNGDQTSIGTAGRNVISGNGGDGISIVSGGATIQGNFIGTNVAGSAAVANTGDGIKIDNNLRPVTIGSGNVISGNSQVGVQIFGTSGPVSVQSNLIGTDVNGTAAIANQAGVDIENSAHNTVNANTISGNTSDGVRISATDNTLQGNFIGTNSGGTTALPNGGAGVFISGTSSNNLIGGTSTPARNIISGNSSSGVNLFGSTATTNLIQGNFIGLNAAGTASIANGSGVLIDGSINNTIGGTVTGAGNVISGNANSGVVVSGGSGTLILGNFIGLNAAGTASVGNTVAGVNISGGSATVGGTTSGSRNVISGNNSASGFPTGLGVYINGGTGSQVLGNFIGTNPAGTAKIGNRFGIIISGAANNVIGGTTATARNVISGNTNVGVDILNAGATNNTVQGNFIGTDVTGTVALGNGDGVNGDGIDVGQIGTGPSNVTIGGTTPGAGNVISGNSFQGVLLFNDLNGVRVQGNLIGTDVTGKVSLGAQRVGIFINTTSPGGATIGGTTAAARNIISGNGDAIELNTFSTGITIQGNYIGTDITGNAVLPNTSRGMFISTNNTTVGGTVAGAGNVISGNGGDAIQIANSSTGNVIQGNFIGIGADGSSPLGNKLFGVAIFTGASNNTIGGTAAGAGNRIGFNQVGVVVNSGTGNAILGNSIFSNTGLAIDLSPPFGVNTNDNCDVDTGPNNLQNFPVITAAVANSNTTTIQGTLNSTASKQFRIEFFANAVCDPSGNGQGRTFLGFTTVTTDGSCNANFSFSLSNASVSGPIITSTATDPDNNTSEFSACTTLTGLFPTIQFSSASYTVGEGDKRVDTTITRGGDVGGAASVSFATSDLAGSQNCNIITGVASSRCDYETRLATVRFAPGETSKTISTFIVDDSYLEGPETFKVNLSNPTGASLATPSTATVTITDNDIANGLNPIDVASFFVRLHYLDFLNREPDQSGLDFWTNQITTCGSDQTCIQLKRINVSAAFYLSIEFQQTGYLVERFYKSAYGDTSGASTLGGNHQLPVPIVRLNEFLLDTQQIGDGVVVNSPGWETVLENNKQSFTLDFVQRSRFTTALPTALTPAQFVNQLFSNAGVTPSANDRQAAINEFGSATNTSDISARSRALRDVAENSILTTQEFNRAFVLMQYFGYLRRNPNDPQDIDYTGYEFWLNKLNQFNGNFAAAEMVKAFISSAEYRQRSGP